jgi:hypothetical protein
VLLLEKMEVFQGRLAAVFKVPTSLHGDVYMRVCRSNYRNDLSAVVIVDSNKFLDLWRSPGSSHDDIAHMAADEWPSDYKFADAADGFSKGPSNPVPLADVGCHAEFDETIAYERWLRILRKPAGLVRTKRRILGFTNGVTRTIWLLHAGAKQFPVRCSTADAPLLQRWAGASGAIHQTVEQLIPAELAHQKEALLYGR